MAVQASWPVLEADPSALRGLQGHGDQAMTSNRGSVGLHIDETAHRLLSIIDMLAEPQMRQADFVVGPGTIQSAHGIAQVLAETVETLMRARRLA